MLSWGLIMVAVRIDVVLTDEAVLRVIQDSAVNGVSRLGLKEIAARVNCHINTAQNAINRLESAERIRRIGKRGNQAYEVLG